MYKLFAQFLIMVTVTNATATVMSPSSSSFYSFTYTVTIPPQDASGESFKLWVPYPAENPVQKIKNIYFSSEEGKDAKLIFKTTQEKKFGNKMVYVTGKTLEKPIGISFEYEIERFEDRGGQLQTSYLPPKLFLKPDKLGPMVPLIREIASGESKQAKKPSHKVRAFYDYVVRSMTYDKTGEGWGRGDAIWACSNKRGNCTDFHSLFIALNRSEGIPARFEIGFPIPADKEEGDIPGYHCWAQAYANDVGWIPVDASEAKKTGKAEEYFGKLPPNRIEFSRGRDITLNPPQHGEALNFFIYPYAEINHAPVTVDKKFYFKRLSKSPIA